MRAIFTLTNATYFRITRASFCILLHKVKQISVFSVLQEYSRCVQEQVAAIKSWGSAIVCDRSASKRAEEQCSAALLDASATVQVKAAQLEHVKLYHKHMRMARAFLEVLAAEKEKNSL